MDLSTARMLSDSAERLHNLSQGGITEGEAAEVSSEIAKIFEEVLNPGRDLSTRERQALDEAFDDVMMNVDSDNSAYGESVEDFAGTLDEITADDLPESSSTASEESGLSVEGDVIDTGRYEIRAKHNEVTIYDKETDTSVRAWGDPHVITSDGDKAQFHEDNLTIDLADGTKVTIQPTEKNDNGLAYVDRVAVTKGDEAVVMSGIHDNDISTTGVMDGEGVADGVDLSFEDGTVLEAGDEVDDLYFTDSEGNRAEELVGEDPSQRFNEHLLDGRGGASNLGAEGAGASGGYDGDLVSRLMEAAANADDADEMATHLRSALAEAEDTLGTGGASTRSEGGEESTGEIIEHLDQLVQSVADSGMSEEQKTEMLEQVMGIMEALGLGSATQQSEAA